LSKLPSTDAVTYLFAPAHEARKVEKALASDADAVVLDFEDSVPAAQKAAAREGAARAIAATRRPTDQIWVRINGDAPFADDVGAVEWRAGVGAVLPKAERPGQVHELARAGVRRLMLQIESARGFSAIGPLVEAAPIVERVSIGTWDLLADLGVFALGDPDESELIWQLRGVIVVESRRFGLQSPVDGVWADLEDDQGLRAASLRACRLGFGGKLLIHPKQIPGVQAAFAPGEAALARARAIVAAYEEAERADRGAVASGGRMIDRPVVERARRLLDRAAGGSSS
jgi:citrate lyase subunit beta/citryl-CoA lyase